MLYKKAEFSSTLFFLPHTKITVEECACFFLFLDYYTIIINGTLPISPFVQDLD